MLLKDLGFRPTVHSNDQLLKQAGLFRLVGQTVHKGAGRLASRRTLKGFEKARKAPMIEQAGALSKAKARADSAAKFTNLFSNHSLTGGVTVGAGALGLIGVANRNRNSY